MIKASASSEALLALSSSQKRQKFKSNKWRQTYPSVIPYYFLCPILQVLSSHHCQFLPTFNMIIDNEKHGRHCICCLECWQDKLSVVCLILDQNPPPHIQSITSTVTINTKVTTPWDLGDIIHTVASSIFTDVRRLLRWLFFFVQHSVGN